MRLPAPHAPPLRDAQVASCAYLDALVHGLRGICLRPAAQVVASRHSRGRHGLALQWHLGLAAHDSLAEPDWEGRIEIKLLTVWRRPDGAVTTDKVKVCDASVDPCVKLANVLWVLVDHATRVVIGHRYTCLAGPFRQHLAATWHEDPHFGSPSIYVESRDSGRGSGQRPGHGSGHSLGRGSSPAYYLTPDCVAAYVLPEATATTEAGHGADWRGVHEHGDAGGAAASIGHEGRGPVRAGSRDLPIVVHALSNRGAEGVPRCPVCRGALVVESGELRRRGSVVARHQAPDACNVSLVRVLDVESLPTPTICSREEQRALVEGQVPLEAVWRVSDRVLEPDDHLHEATGA